MKIFLKSLGVTFVFYIVQLIVLIFFSGAVHGSYAPLAIYGSWTVIPWAYSVTSDYDISVYILLLPPFLYFIYCIILSYFIAHPYFKKVIILLLIFHSFGIIAALLKIEHGHLVTGNMIFLSYFVSIITLLLYGIIIYKIFENGIRGKAQKVNYIPKSE